MTRQRTAPVAIATALAVLLAAAGARAAVLVEVAHGGERPTEALRDALVERLAARGEVVTPQRELDAALRRSVLRAPDPDADEAFVRQAARNATGRNLYFENDFDGAVAILAEGLTAIAADPSVLAFHTDLATGAFEAALTLGRASEALGDRDAASRALRTAASLMWNAVPSEREFPPAFVEEYRAARSLVPTREVAVAWPHEGPCTLWINGFVAADAAPGERLRLPAGAHFLQLECGDRRSLVVRLDEDDARLDFDLEFDDAATFDGGELVLQPRTGDPGALRRVSGALADRLGESVVYTLGVTSAPAAVGRQLELTRLDSTHSPVFRAVRVPVDAEDFGAALDAAVAYLVSGEPGHEVATWSADRGWSTRPAVAARPRRPAVWALTGASAAAAAIGVVFELRTAESVRDVGWCADRVGDGCSDLPGLRSEARTNRAVANAAWAGAGAGLVGTVVAHLVSRPERRDGARAALTPSWSAPGPGLGLSCRW